jgi:hypothetical protein
MAPCRVLPIDELGRYVEEVDSSLWFPLAEFMDECFVGGVVSEGTYHVVVGGVREIVPLLEEPPDVILETFSALLGAPLEVPRASRAFVGALKISDEGLPKVGPVVDGVAWQVSKPGPCSLHEVDGEELDYQIVVLDSHHATSKMVIFQPDTMIRGPVIPGYVC